VSSYVSLGSRGPYIAAADTTSLNTGNWTTAITADLLAVSVPQAEIYHAIVTAVPAGASATILIGTKQFSFTAPGLGAGSEWDPSQPALILPGQDVYFLWSAAASGTPPVVTLWLRYDLGVITAARKGLRQ